MNHELFQPAIFSPCRQWRYTLYRDFTVGQLFPAPNPRRVQFIGLNPSTADEVANDPTVRRCIAYAKDWGFQAMWMTNLFAYRATDPRVMKEQADPVGPDNFVYLCNVARFADMVVCCWGAHGGLFQQSEHIQRILQGLGVQLHALNFTRAGEPGHPLYLSSRLLPKPYVHSPRTPSSE